MVQLALSQCGVNRPVGTHTRETTQEAKSLLDFCWRWSPRGSVLCDQTRAAAKLRPPPAVYQFGPWGLASNQRADDAVEQQGVWRCDWVRHTPDCQELEMVGVRPKRYSEHLVRVAGPALHNR